MSDRSEDFLGNRGGQRYTTKIANSIVRSGSGSETGVLPAMGRPVSWVTMANDGEKSNREAMSRWRL